MPRDYMIEFRTSRRMDIERMAKKLQISPGLLSLL